MARATWADGAAYDAYIGRWSRRIALSFIDWLAVDEGALWVDIGCGTGSLTATVLAEATPELVIGADRSPGFLAAAVPDPRAHFLVADARQLPLPDARFGAVVSGLALNFVPEPGRAVAELTRVAAPEAPVAAYVWDYGGGMAMIDHFWRAAELLDPEAAGRSENGRFPICHPDPLRELWSAAGLLRPEVIAIETATVVADFADYWTPFLGGQGPAPGYVAGLSPRRRVALAELLRSRLPAEEDGTIRLTARAWAVRGTKSPYPVAVRSLR
jgi:SAM-dependent methyltransferase